MSNTLFFRNDFIKNKVLRSGIGYSMLKSEKESKDREKSTALFCCPESDSMKGR